MQIYEAWKIKRNEQHRAWRENQKANEPTIEPKKTNKKTA